MKIVYQEKENECGICVVAMLANELRDLSISRSDLVTKADLSNSGISIASLENLARDYGIELESYECSYQEFLNLDKSKYYVVLVKRFTGFHYLIAELKTDKIKIYDSSKGKYFSSIKDFEKEFANIVFTVKANDLKVEVNKIKKISFFEIVDLPTFIVLIIFQIICIGFGLAVSQLFKVVINDTIAFGTTINLFSIFAPFTLMKLIEILSKSLISWIQIKKFQVIYKKWWNTVLKLLIYQNFNFFNLYPYGTVFELDNHLSNVINFYLSNILNFFSSVIMIIAATAILSSVGTTFILISIFQFFIEIIFALVYFLFQKNKVSEIMSYSENHNKFLTELESSLKNENNYKYFQKISDHLNNNIYEISKLNKINFSTLSFMDNANQLVKYIFSILILGIGSSLVINNENIKLSDLMYAISIQTLFLSYSDNLIQFCLSLNPFITSLKKISGFLDVKINENNSNFIPFEIKKISFENINFYDGTKIIFKNWNADFENLTMLLGPNASGKSTILKSLTGKIKLNSGIIKINEIDIKNIGSDWLVKNIIYLDGLKKNNKLNLAPKILDSIKDLDTKKEVTELFNNLKIFNTSNDSYSSGQEQIIKISSLLEHENKIILLDECLSAVASNIKNIAFDILVSRLAKKNFVIYAEHDKILNFKAKKIVEIFKDEI